MGGVTIDPGLAGFSSEPQQTPQQSAGGGVVIDPSLTTTAQPAPQATRPEAPSGFVQGLGDPFIAMGQLGAKGAMSVAKEGSPLYDISKKFAEQYVPERESAYQRARAAAADHAALCSRLEQAAARVDDAQTRLKVHHACNMCRSIFAARHVRAGLHEEIEEGLPISLLRPKLPFPKVALKAKEECDEGGRYASEGENADVDNPGVGGDL